MAIEPKTKDNTGMDTTINNTTINMKRLSIIICLVAISIISWAAKANRKPFTVTQTDGTQITVILNGDEHFSWYATTDGILLTRNGNNFYIADIDAEGNLRSTMQLAHNPQERSADEKLAIKKQNKNLFFSDNVETKRAAKRREPLNPTSNPAYFPHNGNPTAIVILVNYNDTKFTVEKPEMVFEQYLNGDEQKDYGCGENLNYGSVNKYFKDMSNGLFSPQFDIVGPVTLSKNMEYYGRNSGTSKDINCSEMVAEACQLANNIIDFSDPKYDSNNDGEIDLVYIIYAGYGENNGASENTIWPKSGIGNFGIYNGKKVRRYGVNNELNATPDINSGMFASPKINGIGIFCHEFSHCLGLPDLYPYSATAQIDNQAMEYWSIMDGGEYVYYGYYPTAYTAWEREVLGWHSITKLEKSTEITISAVNSGGRSYKMINDNDPTEYMVMENIQRSGWNRYVPGHGLLVYHVKWPTETVSYLQRPNEIPGKPGFAVIPADGILISSYNNNYTSDEYLKNHRGDTFPGTSEITNLTYEQGLPNYTWYTEGPVVNKSLKNITEDTTSGTVTFNYIDDTTTDIQNPTDKTGRPNNAIYSTDGIYLGENQSKLKKGLYISNHKKIVIK